MGICAGMTPQGEDKDELPSLHSWFVARGVNHSDASKFMQAYRCLSTSDAALILRFELAPLHLANTDSVNDDMKRLLNCNAKVAKQLIQDLDVFCEHLSTVLCIVRSCGLQHHCKQRAILPVVACCEL
jgi:hypothetical protein